MEKCRLCGTVIAQCRCPSPSKSVRFGVCGDCAKRVTDTDDPTPVQGVPIVPVE